MNPLAVSHCVPQLPDVHVAICPVPAGQTFLSRGHDPQDFGSDEGTPQVGGVVSKQVVHPRQPTVGSGELQERRNKSAGTFVGSRTTVPKAQNLRRTRRRVTSILLLLPRRPGFPLTVLNDLSIDSLAFSERERRSCHGSSGHLEADNGEHGRGSCKNAFELHLLALVRHFVES